MFFFRIRGRSLNFGLGSNIGKFGQNLAFPSRDSFDNAETNFHDLQSNFEQTKCEVEGRRKRILDKKTSEQMTSDIRKDASVFSFKPSTSRLIDAKSL